MASPPCHGRWSKSAECRLSLHARRRPCRTMTVDIRCSSHHQSQRDLHRRRTDKCFGYRCSTSSAGRVSHSKVCSLSASSSCSRSRS
ncbi:MOSC domain-containing protein [Citreicella sp. C3M06]|uniref:MOSC domain-containing protein n=1 Tax=Citreicella sp. C3M06 TaxID=2841564 RepID=UPI00352DB3D3